MSKVPFAPDAADATREPLDFPAFLPTEAECALFAELMPQVDAFADQLAARFGTTSPDPMVRASLAAELLIRAAWKIAAATRIDMDGCDPEPAYFIGLATEVAQRIRFHVERTPVAVDIGGEA